MMTIFSERTRWGSFVWLAIILMGLEFIASTWVATQQSQPNNNERSPNPNRFIPEYVECNRKPDKRLAVLIGASHAVGPELESRENIYFSRVRHQLLNDYPDLDFRNWSIAGARTGEIELLVRQAVVCQASKVVLVLSPANIEHLRNIRWGGGVADTELLVGRSYLWPTLSDSQMVQNATWDELIRSAMEFNSDLVRSRDLVWDHIAEKLPVRKHTGWFGHRRSIAALDSDTERAFRIQKTANRLVMASIPKSADGGRWEQNYRKINFPVFRTLTAQLSRLNRTHGTEFEWVWTPLNDLESTQTMNRAVDNLQRDMCIYLRNHGIGCTSLNNTLTEKHFLKAKLDSHYNDLGHEIFADALYPVLRDAFR